LGLALVWELGLALVWELGLALVWNWAGAGVGTGWVLQQLDQRLDFE
jgi:hypothetical protein